MSVEIDHHDLHEQEAAPFFGNRDWTGPDKEAVVVRYLTAEHLHHRGGYPYDYTWVDDTLVVAATDPGKEDRATRIERYPRKDLLAWFDRAATLAAEVDDDDDEYDTPLTIATAFGETN